MIQKTLKNLSDGENFSPDLKIYPGELHFVMEDDVGGSER